MIHKHKRKLYVHLYILKKLKTLKTEQKNDFLNQCLMNLQNTDSNFSTKEKWEELLNLGKTDFCSFEKILISKNDESELLRHTSVLGLVLSEMERTDILKKWKNFERKWNINE